ncbi:MAG TPA: glycosyltransferase family 39 protein, partial [Bacteroidia bacterium]|nr:glycosyltransferase family 39 protein [Bacteroidia bacterium]
MSQKPKKKPQPAQAKPKAAVRAKKPVREGFFKRNSFAVGLFLITFVVFFNGIGNDYALDDEFYTAGGNKLTQKGIHGIKEIFKSHTFYNNDGSGYSYRPVAVASFALETQFFGENPHVSHFFNVLLYALTIVLIFSLLRRWFVTQGDWFSFFICLIFLVHPLHTEVVDNIKCRDELLAIFFMMLTTWAIWKHLETKNWIFIVAYPLFFWAGMLSKHTAIPFYVLIPLAMWFFTDKKLWQIAAYVGPLFISTIVTSMIQKHTLVEESRTYLSFENPLVKHANFMELTATSFYVIGRYLYLHFIPFPLVYYYGSFYVPTISWANPIAIASLLVHIAIGIWTLKELRKKSIIGFGLLFYLINIAAYSNLLQRAPGIMAE